MIRNALVAEYRERNEYDLARLAEIDLLLVALGLEELRGLRPLLPDFRTGPPASEECRHFAEKMRTLEGKVLAARREPEPRANAQARTVEGPMLDGESYTVLNALKQALPKPLLNVDIIAATRLSAGTVSAKLKVLESLKYTAKPSQRKGTSLTAEGENALKKKR